jgi:uncharacterized membrane protein YphA (DoxX/SURF4 family)
MDKILGNKYLTLVSRILLGLVFIVASVDKIAMPEMFAASIQAYQIVPFPLINIFALILPWVELICGVFIIGGIFVRSSSVLVSCLLVVFILGISSAMVQNLSIDCGCFGPSHATPIGWQKIFEDIGLLLLSIQLYYFPRSVFALTNLLGQRS